MADLTDYPMAPIPSEEWKPGMAVPVECDACEHVWLYTGQTPYAQCKCGRSNPILEKEFTDPKNE